jgi:hypothetical protein
MQPSIVLMEGTVMFTRQLHLILLLMALNRTVSTSAAPW